MKTSFVFLAVLCAMPASAQMYKCTDSGKTTFQESPCRGNGQAISVRPAAGEVAAEPAGAVVSREKSMLDKMQKDRKLREIEDETTRAEREIKANNDAMESELNTLKAKKSLAKNNQAGATWEQSLSTEMQAVSEKYKTKNAALQAKIERLEKTRSALN